MIKPYLIIDIETLGTNLNAPVICVAMLNHKGESKQLSFSISKQLQLGAQMDDATLKWWLEQPAATWLDEYKHTTATKLLAWIKMHYPEGGDVWTRGNDFDIPILGNFLERCGGYNANRGWEPWPYWALHNVRTAEILTGKNPNAKKLHDPLEDCIDCIYIIEEFYRILDERSAAKAVPA